MGSLFSKSHKEWGRPGFLCSLRGDCWSTRIRGFVNQPTALTAEERALLGPESYASNPLYSLGKTVAVPNRDALPIGGPARNFTICGDAQLELLDQLTATAKQWDIVYSPDPKPAAGYFFRSDHFPMAKRVRPARLSVVTALKALP